MGLFNFNSSSETTEKPQGESMDFVTQINVGDRDLSKPYIDDRMVGYMGMVYFGEDNLFPNLTNNLYLSSPIHAACINFKTSAICGAGYEFKGYENLSLEKKKELKIFENRVKLKKLIKTITKNYVKHNRAHILLKYSKEEKRYTQAKLIDPEKVRNDQVTIFKDVTKYFISDGFEYHNLIKTITPYSPTNKDEWQMLELRGETGGSPTYPLPDYVSNGNWTYLDGEISYLYKQGIVNSINPSMIFKFPFDTNPETKAKIKRMLTTMGKGAKNMGRILTFFKPKAQQPEIETIATTQNDKLYKQVSQEIKDNIAISHQMNPSLAGVVTAGKLSNDSETKTYYQLFEKNWVIENREIVEDFLNDFCRIFDITEKLELNRFQLIDDEIVEVDENNKEI